MARSRSHGMFFMGNGNPRFLSGEVLIARIRQCGGRLTRKGICRVLGYDDNSNGPAYKAITRICQLYNLEVINEIRGRALDAARNQLTEEIAQACAEKAHSEPFKRGLLVW